MLDCTRSFFFFAGIIPCRRVESALLTFVETLTCVPKTMEAVRQTAPAPAPEFAYALAKKFRIQNREMKGHVNAKQVWRKSMARA